MSKFTEGPWHAAQWEPGIINGLPAGGMAIHTTWENADGYSLLIATLQPQWSNSACAENARLIAAAPDMLAALKELLPLIEAFHDVPPTRARKLRAVINKAEGREP
jgi:hypothetical protein